MEPVGEVLSSVPVFSGPVFRVRSDEVRMPDGHVARLDVVEHGGSFAIAACPAPDQLVLVRQYRHAVGKWLWEIPAGTAHSGEAALDGARRELAEETGFRAARLREIASFYLTPGYCNEYMHLVLAEQLTPGEQALDPDEDIVVKIFTFNQVRVMAERGEINDIKTLLSLCWLIAGIRLTS